MGKRITNYDSASQTQAGTEQGSAQAASASLQGTSLGAGASVNFSQITTDAGVIAAAAAAGERLIKSQNEAQRQATELGLRSLESTQAIAENLLARSAEKSAGEDTDEGKKAKLTKVALIAAAVVAVIYILAKKS